MTLRFTVLLILLLATAPPTISAFTISSHHVNNIHRRSAVTTTATTTICKMSDQWDDETTSSTTNNEPVVTSYDDATKGMIAEAEAKELEAMGGYDDIVPGVSCFMCIHLVIMICVWYPIVTFRGPTFGYYSIKTHLPYSFCWFSFPSIFFTLIIISSLFYKYTHTYIQSLNTTLKKKYVMPFEHELDH